MFANDWKNTRNIDLGVTNKVQQVTEFTNRKSMSNDYQLCCGLDACILSSFQVNTESPGETMFRDRPLGVD